MFQSLLRPTYAVGRFLDGIWGAYSDINPSTLTGAIDVIVVRQEDGSFKCGPFHVRFGKMGALRPVDLLVDIYINGEYIEDLHMRLGSAGEAFFVEDVGVDEEVKQEDELHHHRGSLRAQSMLNFGDFTSTSGSSNGSQINLPPSTSQSKPTKRSHSIARSDSRPLHDDDAPALTCRQRSVSSGQDTVDACLPPISLSERKNSLAPCLSDTALHMKGSKDLRDDCEELQWEWGDFPSFNIDDVENPPVLNANVSESRDDDIQTPIQSDGAKEAMPFTSYSRRPSEGNADNGILLDDLMLSKLDDKFKDEYLYACQTEHTHNASSSANPVSSLGRCSSLESLHVQKDAGYRSGGEMSTTSPATSTPPYPVVQRMKLSLCGGLTQDHHPTEQQFNEHLITYEEFIQDPVRILSDPQLVVLLNDSFLPWSVAAPMLISIVAFQTELPHPLRKRLEEAHLPKTKSRRRMPWFSWGTPKAEENAKVPEIVTSVPDAASVTPTSTDVPKKTGTDERATVVKQLVQQENLEMGQGGCLANSDDKSVVNKAGEEVIYTQGEQTPSHTSEVTRLTKAYKKVNRLSGDKILKLNLREGYNEIEYRVITRWQGTARCKAAIYLWNWYDRLVISDVDGTITRSDVLGNVFPLLGRDWTHLGVIKLYNKIATNGYRFVYLSSRAIGQSEFTRSFLTQLVEESNLQLPKGPILLSPNSLLRAFHLEVIERRPDIFKIQCMKDLQLLFPSGINPFFGGFGNRPTDVKTYLAVGIPESRIFTVDYQGIVCNQKVNLQKTSYSQLVELVDYCFPILPDAPLTKGARLNDADVDTLSFSSFTYYAPSLPCVEDILKSSDFIQTDSSKDKKKSLKPTSR